jgi:hypothetical protein
MRQAAVEGVESGASRQESGYNTSQQDGGPGEVLSRGRPTACLRTERTIPRLCAAAADRPPAVSPPAKPPTIQARGPYVKSPRICFPARAQSACPEHSKSGAHNVIQ